MFGHGSSFCNVNQACSHCSEPHSSQECTNKEKLPKCINCGEQHPATDTACKKRLEFIEIRNRLKVRNRSRRFGSEHVIHEPLPSKHINFNLNSSDFPDLSQKQQHTSNMRPVPVPRSRLETPTSTYSQMPTAPRPPSQNNNNLFSFEEIIALKNEMLCKLSQCKSRQDQFNVIADVCDLFL